MPRIYHRLHGALRELRLHSNTFANGQLLFTYDENTSEWGVALNDWLGTKRVQVDPAIVANLTGFQSLPFGDGLTFYGYGEDSTEHHFTGKERDQESGNDYFSARYCTSSTGRFLSPDPGWMAAIDPSNPQSLNLYSYALNNPSKLVDPSGMILCNLGPTPDSADKEDAISADACTHDGGSVAVDQESVTVTATATSPPDVTPSSSGTSTIPNTPKSSSTVRLPGNNQRSCVGGVLGENAVSLGLDALGTLPIPEAGGITRLVGQQLGAAKIGAIYRGVVADQQGATFLNGLRHSTSAVALLGNAGDTSALGLASTAVGGAALTAGYFVPVLGQVLSGGQLFIDAIHTYNTIQTKCYGHS